MTEWKEKGNLAFEAKRYDEAEELYSKAILQDTKQHTLFGNRSAARFQQKKFLEALQDANTAIELDSTWAKGYFRKGQALEGLKQHRNAQHVYELAIKYGGKKRDVVEKVTSMRKLADEHDRERSITTRAEWKEIYGNLSDGKLRLAILVKLWNASTKAERFSFFMRFLAILSDGSTPARISRYSKDDMEEIPAANYEPINLPVTWTVYFHALDLAKKGEMMEDMYNMASESEKTTIINDMKYYVHQLYKEDEDDKDDENVFNFEFVWINMAETREYDRDSSHRDRERKSSRKDKDREKDREKERKSSRRDKRDDDRDRKSSRSSRRSRSYSPRYRSSRRSRSRSYDRRDRRERRDDRRSRRSTSRSDDRKRSHRSRSDERSSRRRSPSENKEKAAPAPATTSTPSETPASTQPTITQMMLQYPSLSIQEIMAKMSQNENTLTSAISLKPMRELYVGNLPPNVTATQLQEFLGTIIQQVGLALQGQPGNPILSTWISTDGQYAFCEMRTVEECNLALMLNQLNLLGKQLKFGRPRSFVGPAQPMPTVTNRTQTALVNLGCIPNPMWFAGGSAACGLKEAGLLQDNNAFEEIGQIPPDNTSNRLLMANIPTILTEDQVAQLVEPFGALAGFTLVRNGDGESVGSALFEYEDDGVTEAAMNGLNGLDLGGQQVVVQRASKQGTLPSYQPLKEGEVKIVPTPVIQLGNMVQASELEDDEEFADLKQDIEEECNKFGTVVGLEIPRPKDNEEGLGVGNVFVRFSNVTGAIAATKALTGRKFGGNTVQVNYISVAKFETQDFA